MLHGSPDGEMVEEAGLVLRAEVKRLAAFVRASKYAGVYTGAGISTAAGVPDFRGPSGVWTLQAKGKTVAEPDFTEETDHKTGRLCEAAGCSGELESSVVLFGESLSVKEVKSAWHHTSKADLVLVLGSSLRVAPARAMPGQVARNGGRLVLVKLQRSHFDGKASLVIYARCDEEMRLLAEELHLDKEEPCRQ